MLFLFFIAFFSLLVQAHDATPSNLPCARAQPYAGSLAIVSSNPLRIEYKSSRPGAKNWIALYFASGGGPDGGKINAPSIRWSYAPNSQGVIQFDNEGLGRGQYKVYFLADDKYESLAAPIQLQIGARTAYQGIISVDHSRTPINFKFTTPSPNGRNWIGIWFEDGGPVKQVQAEPSLTWDWAKSSVGEVTLSPAAVSPGRYKAYFLADGGYKWLSEPIVFTVKGQSAFRFLAKSFTTRSARKGDSFSASVKNMVSQPDDRNKFTKVGGDGWISVSTSGTVTGTPPTGSGDGHIEVKAQNAAGASSVLSVRIPLRPRNALLVDKLRVLSFNLWYGGTKVKNYHEKQIQFLVDQNVDVAGLQESTGEHGARIARALGWYYWQGPDVSIISRYPIAENFHPTNVAGAVRISLDGPRHQIIVWNCHLGYDPYGPYDFCFDRMSIDKVFQREEQSGRTPQIREIMQRMKGHLSGADDVPILLLGDFNAPSHLDWTEETKSRHCGVGSVQWPTSRFPVDAGLIDSYRVAHRSPMADEGITWSPIFLNNNGRPEPMDRIDFVYHKGRKLTVEDSRALVVGQPRAEPNHADNEWTSDHKAVLTSYKLRE